MGCAIRPFSSSGVIYNCELCIDSYKHKYIYIQSTGRALTSCQHCLSQERLGCSHRQADLCGKGFVFWTEPSCAL